MTRSRTPSGADTLERTRYFPRQIVAPPDLAQDREYLLHRLRRHNRLLHGWGIRLGFDVSFVTPDTHSTPPVEGVVPSRMCWLKVAPGYAISPVGDELYLSKPVYVSTLEEVRNRLVVRPADCVSHENARIKKQNGTFLLIVEAIESETRPVRAAGTRCGDHPDQYEFSRLRDELQFRLIPPAQFVNADPYKEPYDLLTGHVAFDWIVLGTVTLKDGVMTKDDNYKPDSKSIWKSVS